jgi:poly(3-hydroxybutyrate) depolymerase
MFRSSMLVLFVSFSTLVAAQDGQKKAGSKTQSRIEKRMYDFKEAGKEMEYALFVPTTYDKDKKSPLIVALHGLGGDPQKMMHYRGLTDLAEKHGYIVVAPMGYNSSGWYGVKAPAKLGKDKNAPANLAELSEKDVMNVLAIIRKDFSVDDNRIFLMGHSMGGGGTIHLALKNPDLWAALAPIAPALFGKPDSLEKIKHIPIILVQGDKDTLVKVERVRPWAEQMKKLEMKYEYVEVAGGNHVDIAFKKMPDIFEFFNKHKKEAK